jgi:hypothetical protein
LLCEQGDFFVFVLILLDGEKECPSRWLSILDLLERPSRIRPRATAQHVATFAPLSSVESQIVRQQKSGPLRLASPNERCPKHLHVIVVPREFPAKFVEADQLSEKGV